MPDAIKLQIYFKKKPDFLLKFTSFRNLQKEIKIQTPNQLCSGTISRHRQKAKRNALYFFASLGVDTKTNLNYFPI